jgi:RimJ/RimL family protein N-acetyltransferase
MVEVKASGSQKPVGMTGIFNRDTLPGPDIGFAYLPEHIGKGYGLEAASAVLQSARDMKLSAIYAIVSPANERCVRLLDKLGMVQEGIRNIGNGDVLLYKREL